MFVAAERTIDSERFRTETNTLSAMHCRDGSIELRLEDGATPIVWQFPPKKCQQHLAEVRVGSPVTFFSVRKLVGFSVGEDVIVDAGTTRLKDSGRLKRVAGGFAFFSLMLFFAAYINRKEALQRGEVG